MALITVASTASLDAVSAQRVPFISGLVAGEDLDPVAPCYVKSDGKVYMSVTTVDNGIATQAAFAGFTADAVSSGEPVTLFGKGARFSIASGLTPGDIYFVSATAGALSDTAVLANDVSPVAMAISTTDIVVIR
jgi:hypothetical protein